jgi:ABC-type sugar transport system permease subunit
MKRVRAKETQVAWLLLLPIFVYFLIFQAFPIVFGIGIAFFDWVGVVATPEFVGIQNFISFFHDSMYLKALWNSFYIGLIVMSVNVIFGLFGALLLNSPIPGRTLIRSIWYAPAITSAVATSQIFLMFIDPSSGIANNVLKSVGLAPIAWGYSTGWMVFWITAFSCWKGIGGTMILWLAGLQSIDPALYEAADIVGASSWQKLIHITLPSLRGITTYVLITGFIGVIQIFEPVLFISQAGPFGTTDVIVHRVFRDFYGDFNFGMAGTGAVIITLIILVFSLMTLRWYEQKEEL